MLSPVEASLCAFNPLFLLIGFQAIALCNA